MNKRYKIEIQKQENFPRGTSFFCIGSCFSSELGMRLRKKGFRTLINPFGTIYNAASLFYLLELCFNSENTISPHVFKENNLFFSPYFSKEFSGNSLNAVMVKTQKALAKAKRIIETNPVFIITYGTSVVYEYRENIVANCQGLPHHCFTKKILDSNENFEYIKKSINIIQSSNPSSKIILTLSPVRHTPENAIENALSKANLRSALGKVVTGTSTGTSYFPAYEIVLDEYRDYTFFKKDAVHVKDSVVNDIVERFLLAFFGHLPLQDLENLRQIQKMLRHIPSDPTSGSYFNLLKKISENIVILEKAPSNLNLFYLKTKLILPLVTYFYENPTTVVLLDSLFPTETKSKTQRKIKDFVTNCLLLQKNSSFDSSAILNISLKNKCLNRLQNLCIKKMLLNFNQN